MINLEKENQEPVIDTQEYVDQIYDYALTLKRNEDLSYSELKSRLIEDGLSYENAETVVNNIEQGMKDAYKAAEKSEAEKDMLYGAMWCIGGTFLTIAEIGYIFWGAIVFGAYQFLKGLFNYSTA
jgi:hypothetical protein